MQTEYEKKVIEPFMTKSKPSKSPKIFQDGGVWKFVYDGSEWCYDSKENAKIGLRSVNGEAKEED